MAPPQPSPHRLALTLALVGVAVTLNACGQTGPLYLPDDSGKVIIRERGSPSTSPAPTSPQPPAPPDN